MQKIYERINWKDAPDTSTPVSAGNLNKMDYALNELDSRVVELSKYSEEAKESELNADVSEANAKASETNAKESEELAKEYMEKAFAGTPEGYEQLVEDVRLMDIKTTTDTTLADSKAGGYKLVFMRGNSVQNGEPTPTNPIAINNTADCVEIMQGGYSSSNGVWGANDGYVCSKNMVHCTSGDIVKVIVGGTTDGVMLTYYNENGFVSYGWIAGTSTEYSFTIPDGVTKFALNVRNVGGITTETVGKITLTINNRYVVQVKTVLGVKMESGSYYLSTGLAQTANGYVRNKSSISCKGGDVLTFKTSTSMYHYIYYFNESGFVSSEHKQNVTESIFTVPSGITKVNVSVGNGSTTVDDVNILSYLINGVGETVATVLLNEPLRKGDFLFKENGFWKVERNSVEVVFDGSDDEAWGVETNSSGNVNFYILMSNAIGRHLVLCSHFPSVNFIGNIQNVYISATKYLNIVSLLEFTTITEWKTWLQSNPITVKYKLATPTIEMLNTASQIALNSLETFDTVTYINVDSRTQPSEIKSEYGTSIVGARTLKNELRNDTLEIKYNELAVALVATGSEV